MSTTSSSAIQTQLQRALALHRQGAGEAAADAYRAVLAVQPRNFHALHLLGVVELQRGNAVEAERLIAKALQVDPRQPAAAANRGAALRALGRLDEALQAYNRSLSLAPSVAGTHVDRALVLQDLGRDEEALAGFDRALGLNSNSADAHVGRGIALVALGRADAALACYDAALALRPGHAETFYNRGQALQRLARYEESCAAYFEAIALRPDFAEAHVAVAECLLITGDFVTGWVAYVWRWATQGLAGQRREFMAPEWTGDTPLTGKTILLHAEQGFGDTIQFARYASLVAARGARVVLDVPAPLQRLMTALDGPAQVIARGDVLPAFDFHCPLLSLPGAFGTTLETIPAASAYLRADPQRVADWIARLGTCAAPRVGLAWSGRSTHRNDRNRSIPLAAFGGLANSGATLVALQTEIRDSDRVAMSAVPWCATIEGDFADTAAAIMALDLVIAVDTAVAHLAGALGKPVWILLPFAPDWRWLQTRSDSPWYPGARLFRQTVPGDWSDPLAAIARALVVPHP